MFPQPQCKSSLYYSLGLVNHSIPLWTCLLTNTIHKDGMSKVCSNLAWRKSVLLKRNPKANTSFCQHFLAVGHVSLYYVCVTQWFFILGLGNKDSNLILMANNHFPSCKPSLFFVSCYTSMTTLIITKFLQGTHWNIFPSTRDSILYFSLATINLEFRSNFLRTSNGRCQLNH